MRDLKQTRSIFIVLLLVLWIIVPGQGGAWAQTTTKKVSMNLKNAPINSFFQIIQHQTGYNFIMTTEEQRNAPHVTVNVQNEPVNTVLEKVLDNLGYNYRINNGVVSIRSRMNQDNTRRMTGTITDEDGEPLPGAQVQIHGTKIFTVANKDGNFAINIPNQGCEIEYSFVSMHKHHDFIKAGNADLFKNIVMKSATDINEVVVTGYQDFNKSRVAGSVAQISAKDLDITGFNSLEQALQGRLAGLSITNRSGMVGVSQRTRVRGTSTLMGSQEPIWVVDGVIQETPLPFSTSELDAQGGITSDNFEYIRNFVGNSISWLNPMDIDRITILKDASATAIYGVRAANGVIVINTKRGKVGSLSVSYSGGLNVGQRVSYNSLEMMNSKERVAVSKEIFDRGLSANWTNNNIGYAGALNDYLFGKISATEFEAEVAKLETNNTDWFKLLYRNPVSTNHTVSFSGGSEKARYYASLNYSKNNGTAIGNDMTNYGSHIGLNMDFSSKFHVSADLSANYSETNGFGEFNPYTYASSTNRAIPGYNDDGSLFYYQNRSTTGNYGGYLFNAINERNQTGNTNKTVDINSSVNAYYDISNDIKWNTLLSMSASSMRGQTWASERTAYIANIRGYDYDTALPTSWLYKSSKLPQGGELNEENTNKINWNLRNSIQYDHVFNKVHALTAMIGMEVSSTKYDGYQDTRYGYLPDRGKSFVTVPSLLTSQYNSFANTLVNQNVPQITDTKTNQMGIYLTLNYAYDNRYVANFSVRGDASNRFGQYHNEKFNPVWAGGLRWNMSHEKWFNKQKIFSDASFRSSWGYQRNMSSNYSPSLIVKMASSTGAISSLIDQRTGDYLLQIRNLPYDDLRWEKTFSQNYGLDMGIFNNKIRFSFDYYIKLGTDLITMIDVPREYGIESMPVNDGNMRNSGYEFTVGFSPIRTKNFTWNINLNTSKNFNKVTNVGIQTDTWMNAISGNYHKKGYASTSFWAFKFNGVDQKTGYPIIDLSVPAGADTSDPTSYMVYVGKITPDFTGGLSTSFRYKQLSLSTSLYLQLGGKKFLTKAYGSTYLPSEFENLSNELVNRWTPENTSSQLPGLPDKNVTTIPLPDGKTHITVYDMYNYSTARVANASSLSCNSLTLSYSFNPIWLHHVLRLKNLSLSSTVTNLFIIHSGNFHGRDPEVAMGSQPRTKSVSFNLNIAF